MSLRKIDIYDLFIHKKFKPQDYYKFNSLKGVDFFELLKTDFAPYIDLLPIDDTNKRTMVWSNFPNSARAIHIDNNNKIIAGIIDEGDFGNVKNTYSIQNNLNNPLLTTGNKLGINTSVSNPYFFMLIFPPLTPNKAFACFEKYKNRSVKEFISKNLVKFFKLHIESLQDENFKPVFCIDHHIDNDLMRNYLNNGAYKQISFKRSSLPSDIASKYHIANYATSDFEIELSIKSTKKNRYIPPSAKQRILNMINDNPESFFSVPEFNSLGFELDSTKVTISSEYNNSVKKFDIAKQKIRYSYEIDVNLNIEENSEFKSIYNETVKLLDDLDLNIIKDFTTALI